MRRRKIKNAFFVSLLVKTTESNMVLSGEALHTPKKHGRLTHKINVRRGKLDFDQLQAAMAANTPRKSKYKRVTKSLRDEHDKAIQLARETERELAKLLLKKSDLVGKVLKLEVGFRRDPNTKTPENEAKVKQYNAELAVLNGPKKQDGSVAQAQAVYDKLRYNLIQYGEWDESLDTSTLGKRFKDKYKTTISEALQGKGSSELAQASRESRSEQQTEAQNYAATAAAAAKAAADKRAQDAQKAAERERRYLASSKRDPFEKKLAEMSKTIADDLKIGDPDKPDAFAGADKLGDFIYKELLVRAQNELGNNEEYVDIGIARGESLAFNAEQQAFNNAYVVQVDDVGLSQGAKFFQDEESRGELEAAIQAQFQAFFPGKTIGSYDDFQQDVASRKRLMREHDERAAGVPEENILEASRELAEAAGEPVRPDANNPALGSTAQQQVAKQIQQDLVGILPAGATEEQADEIADAAAKGGKVGTYQQTNPANVPTGVAAATNPFVGRPSSGATYGQLNYGQVSGSMVKTDDSEKTKGEAAQNRVLLSDTMEGRQGQTFTYPTVRPDYVIPGENDLAMSAYEQLRGDIEFDLFSVVKDGYGLGATNTLHLDNRRHEVGVRFKPKLYEPRQWYGHELGIVPPRKELQAVMTADTITAGPRRARRLLNDQITYASKLPGGATAQFLPDDNNTQQSSTGLGYNKPSPLLAHIDTHYYWQRLHDPAGVHMQSRKFRKLYDPLRQPQKKYPSQKGLVRHNETYRRHPITYDIY